jgi:polysaccharide export outer membrane protein
MKRDTNLGLLQGLFFGAAMSTFPISTTMAQSYRLSPGDVLQLTIVGFPDLKQRTPISVDGDIMLPLVGTIRASGLTVSEISAMVKARFANKVMQQRALDGRASSVVLAPDEVTIDIAEYRPIYLRGDVSKPGEQAFRPGMTIRQAVAVSGGYDIIRLRSGNPLQESAQLRGELSSLWNEILRQQATIWRLRAEAGEEREPGRLVFEKSPLTPQVIDSAFNTEASALKSRQAEREREMNYLRSVIIQSDRRIQLLTEQLKNEEEGSKQDVEDFERIAKLFEKGNASITRFSDTRRSMLLSATRLLQTSAAIAQVEREREEFRKMLGNIDDKRRIDVLKELQEAETKLQQSLAKLGATQEQILYSSKMRAQLGLGGSKASVELVVVRQTEKGRERLIGEEDTELWPGDSVEVALDAGVLLSLLPE